jgi:hypothetical protein
LGVNNAANLQRTKPFYNTVRRYGTIWDGLGRFDTIWDDLGHLPKKQGFCSSVVRDLFEDGFGVFFLNGSLPEQCPNQTKMYVEQRHGEAQSNLIHHVIARYEAIS